MARQAPSTHTTLRGNKANAGSKLEASRDPVQAWGPGSLGTGSGSWDGPDLACGGPAAVWPAALTHRPHPLRPLLPEGSTPRGKTPRVSLGGPPVPGQPTGPGSRVPDVCLGVGATRGQAQQGQGSATKLHPLPPEC